MFIIFESHMHYASLQASHSIFKVIKQRILHGAWPVWRRAILVRYAAQKEWADMWWEHNNSIKFDLPAARKALPPKQYIRLIESRTETFETELRRRAHFPVRVTGLHKEIGNIRGGEQILEIKMDSDMAKRCFRMFKRLAVTTDHKPLQNHLRLGNPRFDFICTLQWRVYSCCPSRRI